MKKVLFICLLSLATCLSQADVKQETPVKPLSPAIPKNEAAQTPTPANKEAAPQTNTDKSPIPPVQTLQGTPQNPPTTTTKVEDNATKSNATENNTTPDKKQVDPNVVTNNTATDTTKPSNETTTNKIPTTDDTNKTPSSSTTVPEHATTKKNETQPEATTKPTNTDNHVLQARGFDGPSFFGGIILTLGLLAIGFMGFKYYKNQTERNYHTL
ncbi:sialomucin core protein 24-like [Achroia grisella]|uniref:sialomucin core protein 24-like n=1 Tax=Achroia grisella TaxID=688607 RepID=UPI0027D20F9B|nr:sialomucin core protein 24-like [Achroia grisella]